MQIALDTPARKWGFLGAVLAVAGLTVALSACEFLASHLSTAADLGRLQAAVRLAPGNAEYHQMLGRYLFLTRADVRGAAEQYRAATRLNPHDAHYWFDLAVTDQILDDIAGQRDALEHAILADPTTPDVAWEAGNFFLVQGDIDKALREFKVVVENEPTMAPTVLQLCARAADVETVVRQVLPPQPDAYLAFVEVLTSRKDNAGAAKVWSDLVQLGQPFETRRALDYVNYLILAQEVGQARVVWEQTAELCGLTAYLSSHDNLIVNANFDSEILNTGFDWHYRRQPNVELALDPTDFHSGHRSLAVVFDGPGVNDAGIFQFVPVEAETEYNFSAYYKAEAMDGAGGPRFAVQDAYSGATYFVSDDLKDADIWREVGGQFKTSPDARLVVVRVLRVPQGSPIRGKLWIDDLRLVEKQP
jgi:tetratricopeptide (TPR) repeat protein